MNQIIVQGEHGLRKVAVLEDGRLVEFHLEETPETACAGNIYKGRVVNVLPGMQAAFVDIGLKKNAFLYIDDLLPVQQEKQSEAGSSITDWVQEGAELIVQVKKESFGSKGARVTTHLNIPGRLVVLMPQANYVAISKRIEDEEERDRLLLAVEGFRQPSSGLIVRTVAEGESIESLEQDAQFVYGLWSAIEAKIRISRVPTLLYRDLDMLPRIVRDLVTDETDELLIQGASLTQEMIGLVKKVAPALEGRIEEYKGNVPVFESLGIDLQLDVAFQRNIALKNGGYIVVDRTEALTVIDVNTGKYVGGDNLQQTVYDTNLEAAEEIARLIRLRSWGGIIIIDFIDMDQDDQRERIAERLHQGLKRDRNQATIMGWTKLGLLELTRKKIRPSLDRHFFHECGHCLGQGYVLSGEHPSRKRRGRKT